MNFIFALMLGLALGACAGPPSDVREIPSNEGYASWYGPQFHGRKTASGEIYNMNDHTAAHRSAPFGTKVKVTNLANGTSTVVRINDRGPFVRGRIIDLSLAAAKEIGLVATGTAKVRLEVLGKVTPSNDVFVQVGAFKSEENAQKWMADLRRKYPEAPMRVQAAEGLYRIWLGPYPEGEKTVTLLESLRSEGLEPFLLQR